MSNLLKQNQNLPTKQSGVGSQITFGLISNYIYDNFIKGRLPIVISCLTGQLAYLRGLDWFWVLISCVVVFFLVTVSLHLIDWWCKNTTKEEIRDLSILPEDETKMIDTLKIEHQKLLKTFEEYKADAECRNKIPQTKIVVHKNKQLKEIENPKEEQQQTLDGIKFSFEGNSQLKIVSVLTVYVFTQEDVEGTLRRGGRKI
jgi:hypothetical protein